MSKFDNKVVKIKFVDGTTAVAPYCDSDINDAMCHIYWPLYKGNKGVMSAMYCTHKAEIKSIKPCTEKEYETWKKAAGAYNRELIKDKGYSMYPEYVKCEKYVEG